MGYDPSLKWGEHLLLIGDSESYAHIAVNPVERRIQELANPQQGQRRCYILTVRRKVVIPNLRYSWLLFEHLTDAEHTEPVDTVVLDVDQDEASKIDRQVAQFISVSVGPVPA